MGNLVVVGVDGSSSSLSAVEAAVGEAQRRRAELRVVHAFSWPVRPMYAQLDPSPLNRLVHEAAQHAQSVAPEVEVTEAVVTGDAVTVLEAESRAADLVVVGSRGMGGFIGMLLGSTAVSLAAHGQCPVMVVREEQAGAGPIVLGVDGSPVGEKAVDFAFAEAALRRTLGTSLAGRAHGRPRRPGRHGFPTGRSGARVRRRPRRGTDGGTAPRHQAAHRLQTVAAAVYLPTPGGDELLAAMIGGSPPSVLTLPGRPRMQEPENGQRLRGCRRWEAGGTSAMLRVPALANRGGPPLGRPCGGPVGVS